MVEFAKASYLAQVLRLRRLGLKALESHGIRDAKLVFINHAENTTFRVETRGGERYLLRIHRPGYHTPEAIGEELAWLRRLSESEELLVPEPVRARDGQWLVSAAAEGVPAPRSCSLFKWGDGRFFRKSIAPAHLRQLGRCIAILHESTRGRKVRYRIYWDTEGLIGSKPTFGPIDNLPGIPSTQQRRIDEARQYLHRRFRRFQALHPDRMGLIHADLHFGNVLAQASGLRLIDFDDCGLGFHAYDLAIPLYSLRIILKNRQKELPAYRDALLEGYSSRGHWDAKDDAILPLLLSARTLLMLGWLNSRSDQPKLRAYLKTATAKALRRIDKDLP